MYTHTQTTCCLSSFRPLKGTRTGLGRRSRGTTWAARRRMSCLKMIPKEQRKPTQVRVRGGTKGLGGAHTCARTHTHILSCLRSRYTPQPLPSLPLLPASYPRREVRLLASSAPQLCCCLPPSGNGVPLFPKPPLTTASTCFPCSLSFANHRPLLRSDSFARSRSMRPTRLHLSPPPPRHREPPQFEHVRQKA